MFCSEKRWEVGSLLTGLFRKAPDFSLGFWVAALVPKVGASGSWLRYSTLKPIRGIQLCENTVGALGGPSFLSLQVTEQDRLGAWGAADGMSASGGLWVLGLGSPFQPRASMNLSFRVSRIRGLQHRGDPEIPPP